MKKLILTSLLLLMTAIMQPTITAIAADKDMATYTCTQLFSENESIYPFIMWADGYMSAMSDVTLVEDEWIAQLGGHFAMYCTENPNATMIEVIEAMEAE